MNGALLNLRSRRDRITFLPSIQRALARRAVRHPSCLGVRRASSVNFSDLSDPYNMLTPAVCIFAGGPLPGAPGSSVPQVSSAVALAPCLRQ